MYDKILSDLQQKFRDTLLTPEQVAEVIKTDAKTQANMRSVGTFPIPVRKIGKKVFISIYDLAKFINGDFENEKFSKSSREKTSPIKKVKSKYDWLMFVNAVFDSLSFQYSKNSYHSLLKDIKCKNGKFYKKI